MGIFGKFCQILQPLNGYADREVGTEWRFPDLALGAAYGYHKGE